MFSCFSRQIPTTAFAAPVVSLSPTWPLPINPDFVARPQSRVSFQSHFLTLLLWPFHCSLDPSGCELTQGWGKAPWYSGQLTHAHFYSSHGHLHWDPRPSLCLQLHLRAVPLHRAGRPSAPSVSAISFPSRYSFAFFQSWSYFASSCCISDSLPTHSISLLASAEIISDFRLAEFHTRTDSHLFGCLLCTWHLQQQPAPPGMGNLGHWAPTFPC